MNLQLNLSAVGAGTYDSDDIICQRRKDETALLQVDVTAGGVLVGVYGKSSPDAPWQLLYGQGVTGSPAAYAPLSTLSADGYLSEIPVFPIMRVTCFVNTGPATVKAWFVE